MFAFSWKDLSAMLGVKVGTAQKQAAAGKFDPTDLESVAKFWVSRQSTQGAVTAADVSRSKFTGYGAP